MSATAAYATTTTFSDTSGNTFENQIEWLASHNVASGYPDGTFRPNNNLTRGQMAAYLFNYNNQYSQVSQIFSFVSVTSAQATATCPAGKRALAGGGHTGSGVMTMTDSYASATNQWTVRWSNPSAVSVTGTVWALCGPDTSS